MDKKRGVAQFLLEHAAGEPVSFHMPGHKGGRLYREYGYEGFLERVMDCDVTEFPGADNLFQPEGVIRETMNRYKAIYGAKESFLLVGGSSAGLIAAIMTCVPAGGKLIMARNCHKAVFNGLRLAGGQPVYAYPQELAGAGISGPVLPSEIKRCLAEHPDASAVILPSPNYYGICSDIKGIADLVHEAGMVLIVDQAHGAHLKLFDQYAGSWTGGAASGREAGATEGLRTADRKRDSLSGAADGLRAADRFRAAENQGADVIDVYKRQVYNNRDHRKILVVDGHTAYSGAVSYTPLAVYKRQAQLRAAAAKQLRSEAYSNEDVLDYFLERFDLLERFTVSRTVPVDRERLADLVNMTPVLFDVDKGLLDLSAVTEITVEGEIVAGRPRNRCV